MDDPTSFKKGTDRYYSSKLLNILWLRELSGRTSSDVVINGVNPGFCASVLHRSHAGFGGAIRIFAWTAEQGGHCLADAAMQHTAERAAYISDQIIKE